MATPCHSPASSFPLRADVPAAAGPPEVAAGRYLIDGRVETDTSALEEIRSPVLWRERADADLAQPLLGAHPKLTAEHSRAALEAACRAYGKGRGRWPTAPVAERIACMEAFLPRLVAARDRVARLIAWEVAKPLPDAYKEVDRTADYIRQTIAAVKDLDRQGARFVLEPGFVAQIRRGPLGVALCMGPFNYPLNETFATLIPALIMGNAVIVKPPKLGVLLYTPLLEAFAECFPPGVVNVLFGDGPVVVGPLMESGRVDVLAFIGTARVASLLKHQHPRPNRLRSVLGLEAKNPAIVLPDADLDVAVRACVTGALSFNGQRCTAIKLIFCHRSLADRFVERLTAEVEGLSVGMPWEPGVTITPLAEPGKPAWMAALVDDAIRHGARVTNRGGGHADRTLYHPAVLYPVALASRIANEEQFGPIVPVVPYDDLAEVIDWMTDSPTGQQAAIFGDDAEAIGPLVDALANLVCRVNLNSQCQRGPDTFPFTGRKDSAEGTLSVADALRAFSIRTLVACERRPLNERLLTRIVTERRSSFLSTDFLF